MYIEADNHPRLGSLWSWISIRSAFRFWATWLLRRYIVSAPLRFWKLIFVFGTSICFFRDGKWSEAVKRNRKRFARVSDSETDSDESDLGIFHFLQVLGLFRTKDWWHRGSKGKQHREVDCDSVFVIGWQVGKFTKCCENSENTAALWREGVKWRRGSWRQRKRSCPGVLAYYFDI